MHTLQEEDDKKRIISVHHIKYHLKDTYLRNIRVLRTCIAQNVLFQIALYFLLEKPGPICLQDEIINSIGNESARRPIKVTLCVQQHAIAL